MWSLNAAAAEPDALTDVLQINSRFPYCGIRFIFMSFSVHGMLNAYRIIKIKVQWDILRKYCGGNYESRDY